MIEKKTARDAIESLRTKFGVSQQKIAEKIGLKNMQGFQSIMKSKQGMRTDNFIKLANALGYDVIIRNRVNDEEIQIIVAEGDDNE